MTTEPNPGSGVVARDFEGDFCRGGPDNGLPPKEPVVIGADFLFVGDGTSSLDVSEVSGLRGEAGGVVDAGVMVSDGSEVGAEDCEGSGV
jgi:hypothetical protein